MFKVVILLLLHLNSFFSIEFQKKESDQSFLHFAKPASEQNVYQFSKKLPSVKPALLSKFTFC